MTAYKSYLQVERDLRYMNNFDMDNDRIYHHYDMIEEDINSLRIFRKLVNIWKEHIKEKYETTMKSYTSLGRFLKKYHLPFKEFLCLLELIGGYSEDYRGIIFDEYRKNPFSKHRVRYESSQLKRHSLVYRIIDPLKPMVTIYEISYKAQLALKNRKYTEEYEQLDLALEEESKRNSPDELEGLYYVIEPKFNFNDIVAPKELTNNLKTALAREKNKDKIFKGWGFKDVIDYGRGTTLNFRGPPGTGKTLAANCLAKELGRKLLMVRYDQLQNCFVGVTEKHIQMVFKLAKIKNAVLFFDEADAIALSRHFLERSWEISQVNTLLKELERFEGVCIFATNFAEKYDDAFERRLTMHIDFKLPDKEQSLKILDKLLPKKSRDKNFSFEALNMADLSGGDLKNVVLNAAGIAAKEKSSKISNEHIEEAISIARIAKSKGEEPSNKKQVYMG